MNWYLKVLNQYSDFNSRARRKEYWMFTLVNFIISLAIVGIDNALGLSFNYTENILGSGVFNLLYNLLILVPSLAVAVRRLHDIGKSGLMLLIGLIPLVGAIWLLILLLRDSEAGENKYGANPKKL
ncbi:MAG TPA: DUF805 domain-containing protein [Flavobacteriales bacterium]|nr:DUF805 domain-containing protein [Flavobacteriales bacterium]